MEAACPSRLKLKPACSFQNSSQLLVSEAARLPATFISMPRSVWAVPSQYAAAGNLLSGTFVDLRFHRPCAIPPPPPPTPVMPLARCRLTDTAAATSSNRVRSPSEELVDSDEGDANFSQASRCCIGSCPLCDQELGYSRSELWPTLFPSDRKVVILRHFLRYVARSVVALTLAVYPPCPPEHFEQTLLVFCRIPLPLPASSYSRRCS